MTPEPVPNNVEPDPFDIPDMGNTDLYRSMLPNLMREEWDRNSKKKTK